VGIFSHGGIVSLFLNYVSNEFDKGQAEKIKNPDILKVTFSSGNFFWNKDFIPGLIDATDHRETPIHGMQVDL